MAKKTKSDVLILVITSVLIFGGMIVGGEIDSANNMRSPNTAGSNADVLLQYEIRIDDIVKLKGDKRELPQESIAFFGSTYVDEGLSEADVASLTEQFSAKVALPSTLLDGYVLEHPEYLDECKEDITTDDLVALDKCTLNKYQEAYNDGPLLGMAMGFLAGVLIIWLVLGVMVLGILVIARFKNKKDIK